MTFLRRIKQVPVRNVIAGSIAFLMFMIEATIAAYEFRQSSESFMALISCIVFSVLATTSLMYTWGMVARNECLLLPLLTRQVILTPLFGVFIIFWWIGAMLSYFDLVHYGSPISSLSTSEFFVITGLILTVSFVIFTQISIVLYKGYKRLDSEVLDLLSNGHVLRSHTFPPTDV
ncbi:hypothetical protein PFISCL1PPCAC_25192 [Pristionchus fissidentatus]|uniref:G protein-coupled receptor n=1 Tax=Pristionchus fissidentatus TaxID=1538716 RepID=A0AAV5WTE3_9BILA|nr:hypothetical protein PFISCL1PPCAC_25192 [Pristionchus fissidentatus]